MRGSSRPGSSQSSTVIHAQWHGSDALELTYKTTAGSLGQQVVFRKDEDKLSVARTGSRAFNGPASDFKLVAEAQRITLAGLFDPMLAVATSDIRPLPHQIRAVYGELLPRTPLRFLLADDPGAGKTIMAGLYIKELLLRDDVRKCLIVAPGGLVEQWQDELFFKFGLRFDLLTNQLIDANVNLNVFETNPLLIARMDQLSRNEQLQAQLKETEWDLIIVDEAHRMGAHYFGAKVEKTKRFLLGELLGQTARHLLLMTATPHSGKEEDFQLFLTLLDRDRFEGKQRRTADTSGIMRRMIKEDLLTFEGKKLFPERIAETVPYELTSLEHGLYERVTSYVREGMNRAERVGGKRKNTVGFALTVLQRRLASSPEAIYKSLVRRSERLERRKQEILNGTYREREPTVELSDFDDEEYNAEEIEEMEEELLDAATAAQTVQELNAELVELADLVEVARRQICGAQPPYQRGVGCGLRGFARTYQPPQGPYRPHGPYRPPQDPDQPADWPTRQLPSQPGGGDYQPGRGGPQHASQGRGSGELHRESGQRDTFQRQLRRSVNRQRAGFRRQPDHYRLPAGPHLSSPPGHLIVTGLAAGPS